MELFRFKNFDKISINEGDNYETANEIAGYDNAIVLYLADDKNIPDKIKWINSIAVQANCKAQFISDNMVLVLSKNDDGDNGDLKRFVKELK